MPRRKPYCVSEPGQRRKPAIRSESFRIRKPNEQSDFLITKTKTK